MANYVATSLRPDFKIPRITGLDPAMPLFVTAEADNKLDASDAEFVDVIHTNALVQGKIERSGDVDFYVSMIFDRNFIYNRRMSHIIGEWRRLSARL